MITKARLISWVMWKKSLMMMTRATAMTLITSIDMTTIIVRMARAMATLPTKNNDVDGNAKDAYAHDVDQDDDIHENGVVTRFERNISAHSKLPSAVTHIKRPL